MSKRRPTVSEQVNPPLIDGEDVGHMSPFVVERAMAGLTRALRGKNFQKPGEADEYINKLLDEGGAFLEAAPQTELDRAQEIVYIAAEEDDLIRRVALAESAVAISGDCADAFVLLGDDKAMSANEARAYYEEAVRAGARAIGEKGFAEDVGHFWGILETRPYMRARARLAECLAEIGDTREAVAHLQELLRLNPADNQGNRYVLLGLLVELQDDAAVEALLASNPDESGTGWLYDKGLWLIQRHAPIAELTAALDDAIETNPFVPPFILGRKRVPAEIGNYVTWHGEDEAGAYAIEAKPRWVRTAGALEHLRHAVARRKKGRK